MHTLKTRVKVTPKKGHKYLYLTPLLESRIRFIAGVTVVNKKKGKIIPQEPLKEWFTLNEDYENLIKICSVETKYFKNAELNVIRGIMFKWALKNHSLIPYHVLRSVFCSGSSKLKKPYFNLKRVWSKKTVLEYVQLLAEDFKVTGGIVSGMGLRYAYKLWPSEVFKIISEEGLVSGQIRGITEP